MVRNVATQLLWPNFFKKFHLSRTAQDSGRLLMRVMQDCMQGCMPVCMQGVCCASRAAFAGAAGTGDVLS